jgi:hypothetical protein
MRIPRWPSLLVSRTTERDLRDELQFHIDMRTERHVNAGLTRRMAEALAREQFGDMEAAMDGMRRARITSVNAALIVMTTALLIVAGMYIYSGSLPGTAISFPQLASVPAPMKFVKRPPPPPPGPTWEEFVAKVNTFGDSGGKRTPKR